MFFTARTKTFTCFLMVLVTLIPISTSANDGDAALHMGFSALFGAASETLLHCKTELGAGERILYGALLGTVPGLAKEIADGAKNNNHFSGSDMTVDVVGALLGSVVANYVNSRLRVSIEHEKKTTMVSLTYPF